MVTLTTLNKYKKEQTPFAMLTCYDAMFAHAMKEAKIDAILIGDSLGMVVQGHTSTIPVTMDDMVYHTKAVARANDYSFIICDLPFMSYTNVQDAVINSRLAMQAGAHAVKLEGDSSMCDIVSTLTKAGTPVVAHLGLTPQSVNVMGGYKVQAKQEDEQKQLIDDCLKLQEAGAAIILLECVPRSLAETITKTVSVPVIGIGAGVECDGQVLVMHDMLGVHTGYPAKFVKDYLAQAGSVTGAFSLYREEVRNKQFPLVEHSFK